MDTVSWTMGGKLDYSPRSEKLYPSMTELSHDCSRNIGYLENIG
jgi:hypothetical protein